MGRALATSFFALAILTACGQQAEKGSTPPPAPDFTVPDLVDIPKFLEQFPLLDSNGQQAAPEHKDFTGHPVGVLIGIPKSGKGTFCSASHVDAGFVATNAHCVDQRATLGPERYFVVFYNHQGEKKSTALESFVYVGSSSGDDVAILKIPAEAGKEWDVAGRKAFPVPQAQTTTGQPEPKPIAFPIHIWAFDPFNPSHPDLAKKYGKVPGMIFQPRTCQMTRTKPTVVAVKVPDQGALQRTTLNSKNATPTLHFFVDQCDRMPVHGNSGSLVTVAERFDDKIGVYHWGIESKEGKSKYDYFEYTGSDGVTKYLHEFPDGADFFGVGYLFEHFGLAHPGVLF